jgi:hypothetical protein
LEVGTNFEEFLEVLSGERFLPRTVRREEVEVDMTEGEEVFPPHNDRKDGEFPEVLSDEKLFPPHNDRKDDVKILGAEREVSQDT